MAIDRQRGSLAIVWALMIACVVFLMPPTAMALTLNSPATECLDSTSFSARMLSTDSTGTALLLLDKRPVASMVATPGAVIDFGAYKFAPGTHSAMVLLRSREGTVSSAPLSIKAWGAPAAPQLVSPTPNGYAAAYVAGSVRAGLSTILMHVYVNGGFLKTISVIPGSLQNIGTIALSRGRNTIELVAANPFATTRTSYTVNRLDYPWSTCLIIDKSDCQMYWVRDGVLVKTYPIAVGKRSTQTPVGNWKIGAKYVTGPVGIYGPRKMRMYRQTSSGYVFTAYNIHGTNQEWVIGTWASHGCIRMYNRDVLELYPQVPIGTMVQTRE
ncbi:MAG: L,D-transpeptidase [Coriobacteriia bacterium]|nr:L,D-transpeptidase [Coriobacteriia bacterium]